MLATLASVDCAMLRTVSEGLISDCRAAAVPAHTASYLSAVYADEGLSPQPPQSNASNMRQHPEAMLQTFASSPEQAMHGPAAGFAAVPGLPQHEAPCLPFVKQMSRSGRDDASGMPAGMPLDAAADSWGSWLQETTLTRPWRAAMQLAGASANGANAQPGTVDAAGRPLAGAAWGTSRAFGGSQDAPGGDIPLIGPDAAACDGSGTSLAPVGAGFGGPALAFGPQHADNVGSSLLPQTSRCALLSCLTTSQNYTNRCKLCGPSLSHMSLLDDHGIAAHTQSALSKCIPT